jgi:hypothetical protein
VYPIRDSSSMIQLCTCDTIAVGGGAGALPPGTATTNTSCCAVDHNHKGTTSPSDHEWGYGLCIESDMLHGSTSPCHTFYSPSLSSQHADGSRFDIINLELWTLTPCITVQEAERLEFVKRFLQEQRQ